MNALVLLALAAGPGLAICIYIYRKDKFNKEPQRLLIFSFILGMIAIIPAYLIEVTAQTYMLAGTSTAVTLIFAFVVIGCTEEGCKFFMLRIYSYRQREFDEPFDGIIYAVMVAMGFATLENIMYVSQFGYGNAFLRMFSAIPAHAVCGIIMGYYAGLAKFTQNPTLQLFKGWLYAVILHGAYDFSLMDKNIPLITIGAGLSLYLGIRFSLKAIKLHQQDSLGRSQFSNREDQFSGPTE